MKIIISFEFTNFQSFKDTENISFESSMRKEGNPGIFEEHGEYLTKLLMVIGPNGSGKSNLLRALSFVTWFMLNSFGEIKPGQAIPVSAHFFSSNAPSQFKLVFQVGKERFEYALMLNAQRVFLEQLRSRNPKSKKFKTIFKRHFDENTQKYIWEKNKEVWSATFDVQDNVSTISTGVYLKNKLCEKLAQFRVTRNVQFIGLNTYQPGLVFQAGQFFFQHLDLFEQARKILPKLDLGLSDLEISTRDALSANQQSIKIYMPVGVHKGLNQEKKLDFLFESMGTQAALWLLQFILPILAEGGVCILDEFDTYLHPDLLETLLNLFLSPISNPHNAQLIFSSHQHELLNQFEKSQIQLVEKNKEECTSHTWRLDQIKGVRPDENYTAKYRAGAYGAVHEVEWA